MVTEGGQGAGIYDEQLEYLCLHAYTARHSEPDTHCIRFEITHVRSTWLNLVNLCKYTWLYLASLVYTPTYQLW